MLIVITIKLTNISGNIQKYSTVLKYVKLLFQHEVPLI